MSTNHITLSSDGSYTKVVDTAVLSFTVQALDGAEAIFADAEPSAYDAGLRVKALQVLTRSDGNGHLYMRPYRPPGRDRVGGAVMRIHDA